MAEQTQRHWIGRLVEWVFGSFRRASDHTIETAHQAPPIALVDDPDWPADTPPFDALLRAAYWLLKQNDSLQLVVAPQPDFATGARHLVLPLHIELNERLSGMGVLRKLEDVGLKVPRIYFNAAESDKDRAARFATATLAVPREDTHAVEAAVNIGALRDSILRVLGEPVLRRVGLSMPLSACRGGTLGDIGIPPNRTVNGRRVDGTGVVVGIIDDGCALANRNFIASTSSKSRVLYLWDQSPVMKDPAKGWTSPTDLDYGHELVNLPGPLGKATWIDNALAAHTAGGVIDEDAVYKAVDYVPSGVDAHGTHVMDIAVGNGSAMFATEGVAPAADIIFVQLPRRAVDRGGIALSKCLQDGAEYIFNRADRLGKRAVVNISYGGYVGPHDGTYLYEQPYDDLLAKPNRAIVFAAGNGFGANCHLHGTVAAAAAAGAVKGPPGGPVAPPPSDTFAWWVPPDDPTLNLLDLWYGAAGELWLYLTPPGGSAELGPIKPGDPPQILKIGATVIGWINHRAQDKGNGDRNIVVVLRPSIAGPGSLAAAPFGTWTMRVENRGSSSVEFHAWIERDENRFGSSIRRRQSHFDPARAHPMYTVTGIATGHRTIAVGAFNSATGEVPDYSACGPTRATTGSPGRSKPEVCAPVANDVAGRGVLSASSRRAIDTRMNGTSAAAPHVAGLAALVMQVHRDLHKSEASPPSLAVDDLRNVIIQGAAANGRRLKPSLHQSLDPAQPHKQSAPSTLSNLKGFGAIDALETLKNVK